jgi:ElaB/YqjD/DUF883 family membrane-anchored ribosome-binding protein
MASTNKGDQDPGSSPNPEALMDDIAALRRDFATLTAHLKAGAVNEAARSAAGHLSDEADRLYEDLAGQGERLAKALSRQVHEQPLASVLAAFGLGFIISRLLSR